MAKKEVHEEHENHERWLVSYADMMTLLFALQAGLRAASQELEYTVYFGLDALVAGFLRLRDIPPPSHIDTGGSSLARRLWFRALRALSPVRAHGGGRAALPGGRGGRPNPERSQGVGGARWGRRADG